MDTLFRRHTLGDCVYHRRRKRVTYLFEEVARDVETELDAVDLPRLQPARRLVRVAEPRATYPAERARQAGRREKGEA